MPKLDPHDPKQTRVGPKPNVRQPISTPKPRDPRRSYPEPRQNTSHPLTSTPASTSSKLSKGSQMQSNKSQKSQGQAEDQQHVEVVNKPDLPSTMQEPPTPKRRVAPAALVQQELKHKKLEGGLNSFFNSLISKSVVTLINWSAKTLAPALLGAALFPFFGPVGGIAAAVGVAAMVHSIQDQLEPLGLHLQEDTLNKLVEPLRGKQFDETELRKVIWKVLPDRQANEDLKQFFSEMLPTIRKAAKSTTINISGPVQGLIAGDDNTITQTFSDFLPKEDTL